MILFFKQSKIFESKMYRISRFWKKILFFTIHLKGDSNMEKTMNMNESENVQRLVFLQKEIKKHDELYEQNAPVITDSEYDALYNELIDLEKTYPELITPDSPTQRIVTTLVPSLKKVKHATPMLSQDKVNDEKGIRKFLEKNKTNSRVIVELKLDGLTIVGNYHEKELKQAVTRGDGTIGEDVTHTVRTFKNVPKTIDFDGELSVRSEAIIPFEEFERINVDGRYSNPRNLASGTVRQLNASIADERNLLGIAFELEKAEGKTFETDVERLKFMESLGFDVVPYRVFEANEVEELLEYCMTFSKEVRHTLPYMIDGLVIKFDDLSLREELGYTSKFPKWACAFKFESLDATTTLRDVVFQVGKSGQISPVALFDTINIGVKISRATLHNARNIKEKDIRIGDKILVARANDVIPQVVMSIHSERNGSEKEIEIPTECPSCGSTTEYIGANLYCTGIDCAPQLSGKLEHFVGRKSMNIDGLGSETISLLLEKNVLSSFADIYRLHEVRETLESFEGLGKNKVEKMINEIEKSKSMPFDKVLYGMSIRLIGQSASRDIGKHFKSMKNMLDKFENKTAFKEELLSLEKFGEKMADSLIDFLSNPQNQELFDELEKLGLTMVMNEPVNNPETLGLSSLEGKTFVITGALSKGRDEFKSLIEARGGKVSGSVSKKTTYLLMGEDAIGTSKHKKAESLGVTILSEEQFNEL